ncbi:MAG: histidine triad nucleotide-binding protein [Actinomycetales bacterium]
MSESAVPSAASGPASDRSSCLFCRIADGDLPADVVLDSGRVIAFHDLSPQAPTHVLVIPKTHWPTVGDIDDAGVLAELVATAKQVAESEGLAGYRLVFNSGEAAQQTVHHVHGHVLGGRPLTWPPG